MPILMVIGFLFCGTAEYWKIHNSNVYQAKVMESSMQYGEQLPLWGGNSYGKLTLGHTKLSANGKDLAVEIKYDSDAHTSLSSFGTRYALRLVRTEENHMHVKMRYGLFGTDGSGVLDIHSSKGFANQAFVVMIVDRGHLVTSDQLTENDDSASSEADMDKSITAQLSDADSSNSESTNNAQSKRLPPIYIVRLNAHNADRSVHNWHNDRDIVNDLFVRDNLAKLVKQENRIKTKMRRGQVSLDEMKRRVKENPDDTVSIDNVSQLTTALETFKVNLKTAEDNRRKIENSTINPNVLDPVQNKYQTFVEKDLGNLGGGS